jgi:hypothetical protein
VAQIRFLLSFSFFNFTTTFGSYTARRLGFSTADHAFLLAYLGFL